MKDTTETKQTTNPVKVIREFCLDCIGGSSAEVKACTCGPDSGHPCKLYPFRLGRNPYREKRTLTDEEKEVARVRFAAIRERGGNKGAL